jgi:hypothetical protein
MLRHPALSLAQPDASLLLLRSMAGRQHGPISMLAVPIDPVDPAWPLIVRATQSGRRLHVMVQSAVPPDGRRPVSIT